MCNLHIALSFISPLKSKLPKPNLDSLESSDILLTDALTIAEYDFYDTVRIKIGYDYGYTFKDHHKWLISDESENVVVVYLEQDSTL